MRWCLTNWGHQVKDLWHSKRCLYITGGRCPRCGRHHLWDLTNHPNFTFPHQFHHHIPFSKSPSSSSLTSATPSSAVAGDSDKSGTESQHRVVHPRDRASEDSVNSPSPVTSPTEHSPRNFGHPFSSGKTRDDNAIPSPKKVTPSVRRSESAVSSLQAKRNKFLNRSRDDDDDDDDTSPTSYAPARSFKNVVSGSKFAALREKFSAANGNDNNNAGKSLFQYLWPVED